MSKLPRHLVVRLPFLVAGFASFVFSVYLYFVAGGLALTKGSILENDQYRRRVPDDQVKSGHLPTDAKF